MRNRARYLLLFSLSLTVSHAANTPMTDKEREDAFFNRYDVNRDNRITREEMPGIMRSRFPAYDRNRDGFVTKAELRASTIEGRKRQGKLNQHGAMPPVKRLSFNHFDRDRNGLIEPHEMSNKLKRTLHIYDSNRDGMLSRQEYRNYQRGSISTQQNQQGAAAKKAQFTFNHFDRDRNGLITQPEMSHQLKSQLHRYDYNGDGMLNKREYRDLRTGRVGQRYYRKSNPNSFNYLDSDGNGYLSQQELSVRPQYQFFAMDINGDNKITRQEFRQAKQDQMQMMNRQQDSQGMDNSMNQEPYREQEEFLPQFGSDQEENQGYDYNSMDNQDPTQGGFRY